MRGVATDIGTIHFIGIGGIGMSGIAEVMHNLGYQVQGSDIADGYVIEGLRKRGIKVAIGHDAANVDGVLLSWYRYRHCSAASAISPTIRPCT